MYDLFSIVSGFICALYLIIPLVLGVFYILYSFKEKALSKANLITKSILHSIIVSFTGIIIWKINNGLLLFVSNKFNSFSDFTLAFLMLNTSILLTLIVVGSMIRLVILNFSYFVRKIDENS